MSNLKNTNLCRLAHTFKILKKQKRGFVFKLLPYVQWFQSGSDLLALLEGLRLKVDFQSFLNGKISLIPHFKGLFSLNNLM